MQAGEAAAAECAQPLTPGTQRTDSTTTRTEDSACVSLKMALPGIQYS